MNELSPASLPLIEFPSVRLTERLAIIIAPQAGRSFMLDLAARLAVGGPLRVLDGGNQFNTFPVARKIRSYTADLTRVLRGIHMARAFTCYQMVSLIVDSAADATPTLVFDLLATFYDENVTLAESRRLLSTCVARLQCLARAAPVVVGVQPPGELSRERQPLLDILRKSAAQVWEAGSAYPGPTQRKEPDTLFPLLEKPGSRG